MNKIAIYLPIIFLSVLVTLTFLFIVFARTTYRTNELKKLSFKNRFPFEIYYQKNIEITSYFRLILILLFIYLIVIPIFFAVQFTGAANIAYASMIALFFALADICGAALFLVRATYVKQFKILVTLFLSFTLIANVMVGIFSFSNVFDHIAHKLFGGVAIFFGLAIAALAVNPKIRDWAKLESKDDANGSLIYDRPKVSYFVITLWITYLILILGESLLLINSLIASLI